MWVGNNYKPAGRHLVKYCFYWVESLEARLLPPIFSGSSWAGDKLYIK